MGRQLDSNLLKRDFSHELFPNNLIINSEDLQGYCKSGERRTLSQMTISLVMSKANKICRLTRMSSVKQCFLPLISAATNDWTTPILRVSDTSCRHRSNRRNTRSRRVMRVIDRVSGWIIIAGVSSSLRNSSWNDWVGVFLRIAFVLLVLWFSLACDTFRSLISDLSSLASASDWMESWSTLSSNSSSSSAMSHTDSSSSMSFSSIGNLESKIYLGSWWNQLGELQQSTTLYETRTLSDAWYGDISRKQLPESHSHCVGQKHSFSRTCFVCLSNRTVLSDFLNFF